MKWQLILFIILSLVIFFIVTTSLLFYIRHWASRPVTNNKLTAEVEGIYFKRYIPEQLRNAYDLNRSNLKQIHIFKNRPLWARLVSIVILITAVATAVVSLVENGEHLFLPVELEPSEIEALDTTQHQWRRVIDNHVPKLPIVIKNMTTRGFIIPFNDSDEDWLFNGVNIRKVANAHWEYLINQYDFNIKHCNWKLLIQCQSSHPDWITLVLPGFWDFETLDSALESGANILMYGPPAQIFGESENNVILWRGLTFESVVKTDGGAIILRGDQLLTLGFDAGQIISAYSAFKGFRVISNSPQAVSIGTIYDAGGGKETRLFASTIGKGRLVWMDFAPDPNDQSPSTNVNHLNGLTASIFRYLSHQPYSSIATWPQAKPFAALIEEDTEDKFRNAKVVIDLVKNKNYPITWYILSNEALKERALTREMAEVGEVACHGDNHGAFTKSSPQQQVIRIARCQKVLTKITGIRPLGFRPPEEEYNTATISAVANNGMTHFIANNASDRAVPELLVAGKDGKSLVSIPRNVSDDFEMWHTRKLEREETNKLIEDEINWMHNIGGLYMFSFHTQYMGDQDHVDAIDHMGNKLKSLNAYFATSKDITQWWRFRATLQIKKQQNNLANAGLAFDLGSEANMQKLSRFRPVLLSVDKNGGLTQKPLR